MAIPGVTVGEICAALEAGFGRDDLEMMLVERMSADLANLTGPNTPKKKAVFDVVRWSERVGRTTELIRAAYAVNPTSTEVAALYQKYGMATEVALLQAGGSAGGTVPATDRGLEKTIVGRLPQLDFAVWRTRMAIVEGQVCRVEIGGNPAGTGFLVGPDAVLTNYHVLQEVLAGRAPAANVACRFDYKVLADRSKVEGVVVGLHPTDWNLDSSPYSPAEQTASPDTPPPTSDELDYALIRLADRVGEKPPSLSAGSGAPARGWVALPEAAVAFPRAMPLMIAQHPDGGPLKLAVDTESVIGVNAGGTRVRYATNTEPGSSGSP
ncbi:MAG TPA: trypsin-like peptidase domain-containing protein, partial [Urbifossiella sp.]|nr:trypsin-like peptidase domain-containing protein [Urbifossiella sp.]